MNMLAPTHTAETIVEHQKISYIFRVSEISEKDVKKTLTVFLHGWGSSAQAFSRLFEEQKDFVAIDFPGSGKSSGLQKVFTLEDYTRITQKFLEKFVKKHQYSAIVLVGHSFGGRVIMKLMDMFPEQFSAHSRLLTLQKIVFIAVPFYKEKNFQTEIIGKLVGISNAILPRFLKSTVKKIGYTLLGENDYFELAENEVMKKTFQNIVSERSEISQYLHHLEQFSEDQMFCFWGENDQIIPISFAEDVQKNIGKKFKIFPIPNSGHFPWGENPEYFMKKWRNMFL